MANYSLISNARFKPFSFDEMVKPYLMYKQEYDAQSAALNDLATKASVWENKANEQTDPLAYAKYKAYSDNLQQISDSLATTGLNPTTRQALNALRSDYSARIAPIEIAYNRRKELADEQRKALEANPTMLYENMANQMSLDDFIVNPQGDYGQSYSGALITQQVASAASNIAKEARDSEEGRLKLYNLLTNNGTKLPYKYQAIQQNGFNRGEVLKAILDDPDANQILVQLVRDAISTSGVGFLDENGNPTEGGWGDVRTRQRALNYAKQGLYNAIGQTSTQVIDDNYSKEVALEDLRFKHQKALAGGDRPEESNLPFNPMPLRSPQEMDDWNKKFKKFKDLKYITTNQDGSFSITNSGVKQLNHKAYQVRENAPGSGAATGSLSTTGTTNLSKGINASVTGNSVTKYRPVNKEFYDFINELVEGKLIQGTGEQTFLEDNTGKTAKEKEKYYYDAINSALNSGFSMNQEGSYDAYRSTEYDYQLSNEQSEAWTTAVGNTLTDADKKRVEVVEFKGKSGFKRKEYMDWEELMDSGYKVTNVRPSVHGTTVIMNPSGSKSGNPIRIKLSGNLNKRIQDNYGTALANAAEAQAAMESTAGTNAYYGYYRALRDSYNTLGSLVANTVPIMNTEKVNQSVLGY